jgi:hypothetical protein
MTSSKVTLTSAAGEVTLYLAFAFPSFLPPRSPWSRVSLSLVPSRARHRSRSGPALGRSPPRSGVSIVPTDCSSICTTRDHTSTSGGCLRGRRPHTPSTRSGGRRGLRLDLITDRTRTHCRTILRSLSCPEVERPLRRPRCLKRASDVLGAPPRRHQALSWGSMSGDPPRLQRAQWPRPHNRWPPCHGARAPRRWGARRRAPRERAGLTCGSVSSTHARAAPR